MDLELRTIPGCPHGTSAAELFARALGLEGVDPAVLSVREITTDADAAALGFHGSPRLKSVAEATLNFRP